MCPGRAATTSQVCADQRITILSSTVPAAIYDSVADTQFQLGGRLRVNFVTFIPADIFMSIRVSNRNSVVRKIAPNSAGLHATVRNCAQLEELGATVQVFSYCNFELCINFKVLKKKFIFKRDISTVELIRVKNCKTRKKRQYLPLYWSDKDFKGTFVNRALSSLHGESLKITLAVPLRELCYCEIVLTTSQIRTSNKHLGKKFVFWI